MEKYNCFLSRFDVGGATSEEILDVFDDFEVEANSQQEAREKCAQKLKDMGCVDVYLSETSEEVIGTYNGIEVVYYGFDEE